MNSGFNCAGKNSWPELVGRDGYEAAARIESENPYVEAALVPEGSYVTMDYKCSRVRVWVNKRGKVVQVPRVG